MLEPLELAWRLLASLPAARYLQLLPWHLEALLFGLGLLAAFGLHHLIGYTFRFYDAGGHRALLAAVTLAVLVASLQALLLAYLLRTQAEALIRPALAPETAVQPAALLGSILLDPVFSDDDLDGDAQVAKDRLAAVIAAQDDADWRAQLEAFRVEPRRLVLAKPAPAPSALAPGTLSGPHSAVPPAAAPNYAAPPPATPPAAAPAEPGAPSAAPAFTRPEDLVSAILVQIGLRWLLDPDQTWPEGRPAGATGTAERLRLPDFALALVDEIRDDAVLDRLDWEHVAGTRFVQTILQPVLVERVGRQAALLGFGVLAADAAYFVLAARFVGRLRRRARAKANEA
jgi:hypothetical protein